MSRAPSAEGTPAGAVRFEPCPQFEGSDDLLVCGCGWLEQDHVIHAELSVVPGDRSRARRRAPFPERRAS